MIESYTPWVFIDLETTGLKQDSDKIIEFGVVRRNGANERVVWGQMVNPGQTLDPFISRLTGISDAMLADAPDITQVKDKAAGLLEGAVLVAHNAAFDVSFLERQMDIRIAPSRIVDTIELAKIVYPGLRSYSLRSLARSLDIPMLPSHRAQDDALTLEQVFIRLMMKAGRFSPTLLEQISMALGAESRGLAELFAGLLLGRQPDWLRKAAAEQGLADSEDEILPFGHGGAPSYPEGGFADGPGLEEHLFSDRDSKKAELREQELAKELWQGGMSGLISEEGALARKMDNYQHRAQQLEMLEAAAKAFKESRYLMVEAPTGVGKSLAYLIPAVCWAKAFNRKVVVATHTIALQEQLYGKEITMIREALPFSFQCVMLKGRGNYLCLDRWRQVIMQGRELIWGERILLARLAVWLSEGARGDMDSIQLLGPEREWFSQMASSRETCMGNQCQYYRECFFQKARLGANSAQIIIINHALLLSGSRLGEGVLPKSSYLIVDEAHHLEEEGTRYYTDTFSLMEFEKKIQKLHRRRDVFGRPGFIQYLKDYRQAGVGAMEALEPHLVKLEKQVKAVMKRVNGVQAALQGTSLPETFRVKPGKPRGAHLEGMLASLDNLLIMAMELNGIIGHIASLLQGGEGECFEETWLKQQLQLFQEVEGDVLTLGIFLRGIDGRGFGLAEGARDSDARDSDSRDDDAHDSGAEEAAPLPDRVYWISRDARLRDISLCLTPVDIAACFQEYLFADKESVVFTSATLSVNEGFDYCSRQLGIDPELLDTRILSSPFDHSRQVLLLSDKDLPDPARTSEAAYNLALAKSLETLLEACGGRSMVLFTSHKQLKAMFDALHQPLSLLGLELFADGQNGNRSSLLDELRANDKAVVFGANTFWEGVDLPGSYLTSLLIVRLPFSPPGQPLVEARTELLEAEGKDPFNQYSLPQAVLRFKQGYGRLIRTTEDWGVVVVMDNRIINRSYGRVFLKSLPDSRCVGGSPVLLAEKIREWRKEKSNG